VERIETRSLPALTHVLPLISTSRFCPSMSLASPRLRSLAATLAAWPSMSRDPRAPFRSYADTRSSVRSGRSNELQQTFPGRGAWSACHYSFSQPARLPLQRERAPLLHRKRLMMEGEKQPQIDGRIRGSGSTANKFFRYLYYPEF
jgi:hypothetical protein